MQTPKRPSSQSDEIVAEVAKALAPKIAEWMLQGGDEPDPTEEIEACLKKSFRGCGSWDAYYLAKQMERDGWNPDSQLVAALDEAEMLAHQAKSRATQAWLVEHGITPAFAVGDFVCVKQIFAPRYGEIVKIDEDHGQYVVRFHTGDSANPAHRDIHVLFENTSKPTDEPAEATGEVTP